MTRVALIGLGKMGISHQAILNSHPDIDLVAVCDSTQYVLDIVEKYTGVRGFADYRELLRSCELDAVVIATPSRLHAEMVRAAMEHGLHVFCEKPFCLDLKTGAELVERARSARLVGQVGYHYRFVGAFREAKRLIEAGALGDVHHVRAEAYGPVVLRPKGSTWRTSRREGGGCLYDYACHAIDLVNFLVGPPTRVSGSVLNKVFSRDVDDEVYASFEFANGCTGRIAANWSDDSFRKMSMKASIWGTNGRINADRQECQIYLRSAAAPLGLGEGWTVRYTTDLTEPVWYYLRGEEYSAQIDHFVKCIQDESLPRVSTFESAYATDRVVDMLIRDYDFRRSERSLASSAVPAEKKGFFSGLIGRRS